MSAVGKEAGLGKVFSPWKRYTTILGVRLKDLGKIALVVLLGVVLFLGLGTVKREVEVPVESSERLEAMADLQSMAKAVDQYERLSEQAGTDDVGKLGLSDGEKDALAEALSAGVRPGMTTDELNELIPETKPGTAEVFPAIPRVILCVFAPALAAFLWHSEMGHGWSLSSETKRLVRYARRQRFYVSRRKEYLSEGGAR